MMKQNYIKAKKSLSTYIQKMQNRKTICDKRQTTNHKTLVYLCINGKQRNMSKQEER
jgi:hypothetical protein